MIEASPTTARTATNGPASAPTGEVAPIADAWPPRRVVAATLVSAGICLAFFAAFYFHTVLFCVFAGVVVATAVAPLVARLMKWGFAQSTAVPVAYLSLGLLIGGAVVLGAPILVQQTTTLFDNMPETYRQLRSELTDTGIDTINRLASRLPEELPSFDSLPALSPRALVSQTATVGEVVLVGVSWLAATVLVAFYWSLQGTRTLTALMLAVPEAKRGVARELADSIQDRVGAFVRGQGVLCLVVGALSLVAYLLIGLPHAFALAALAGLLEIVPYFGPTLGTAPAIAVAAAHDPKLVVWVLVAAVIVQFLENNLLVPKIMDRSVGVHPIVTLLAIVAVASVYGGVGIILAVPVAAVLQVAFERFVLRETVEPPKAPARRDRASRLRYEVQDLVGDVQQRVRAKDEPVTPGADHVEDSIEAIATDLERALAAVDEGRSSSEELEERL